MRTRRTRRTRQIGLIGLIGLLAMSAQAQTRVDVVTDGNGALVAPMTLWTANAQDIAAALSLGDYVPQTRTVVAGTGLSGGGDLTANRTISLADTSVAAGVYGGDNATLSITVDAQGRLTAAANKTITPSGIGAAQLVGDNAFTGNQSVTGNLTVNGTSTFNGDGTLGGDWTYKGVLMVVGSDIPGQEGWAANANSASWAESADLADSASQANYAYSAGVAESADPDADFTINQNLTVNGSTTLGNAAGDSLTINAGTVVAPNASGVNATNVANVGTLDGRFLVGNPFLLGRGVWNISPANGITFNNGSAFGAPKAADWRMLTGTTTNSTCYYNSRGNHRFAVNASDAGVQYSRPVWLIYAGQLELGVNGVFRVQLGKYFGENSTADFSPGSSSHGMGFFLSNGNIKLETCNTTSRTLSSSLGSYPTDTTFWIDLKARSDGMGNVRVWINGNEVASQTNGPTLNTSPGYDALAFSLSNNQDGNSYFADIANGQITIIVEK